MRNYSKIYLNIQDRFDPEIVSMSFLKQIGEPDLRGLVFYIPRDAKMAGL